MFWKLIIFCFIVLEFLGCSLLPFSEQNKVAESCYESLYMSSNHECMESELKDLEEDLSSDERSIYEMAKRKLSDRYQQLYFLRLTPRERKAYLSYIYDGDPPVYFKNSMF